MGETQVQLIFLKFIDKISFLLELNLNKSSDFMLLRESFRLSSKESLNYKNQIKKNQQQQDCKLINVLNKFIFYSFLLFIILLNFFCFLLLPYYIRSPLNIDEN